MSMTNENLGAKIDAIVAQLTRRIDKLETKVDEIDIDIRGNGNAGMKHRIRELEEFAKEIKWGMRIVVAAVLLEIVARLAGII